MNGQEAAATGRDEPVIPEVTAAALDIDGAGENLQLVDVREPEEWATGRIAGAIAIPLGDLPDRLDELDPARAVVTVCRSGGRSAVAADFLLAAGFADVRNMTGGMLAWDEAGRPIVV